MKPITKKEPDTYSFEEYKKRFPPPTSPNEKESHTDNLAELGAKLAEKSLAKVRQQAREAMPGRSRRLTAIRS